MKKKVKTSTKKANNNLNSGVLTILVASIFTIVVLSLTIIYLIVK